MTIGRIPSVEGGIQPTIVDAKGDLIAATAADTVNRLAVGSNDQVLVADSSTSTGLAWKSVGQLANPVINGGMDIWQRGTSFSLAASSGVNYVADRWSTATGANQASTISRQTTGDTTNLPFVQYCARVQRNSGQTGTGALTFVQMLETVNSIPFVGRTITYSFYARVGANFSGTINATVWSGTGTDQTIWTGFTSQAFPINTAFTPTTTWQRFSFTATIGATITQLAVGFNWTPSGTAGTNDYYEITGLQVDLGSTALPFRRSGGTIQGELAACQRYYWRNNNNGYAGAYAPYQIWMANTTTQYRGVAQFPVTMRTKPSLANGGSAQGIVPTLDQGTTIQALLTSTSSGLTVGYSYSSLGNIDGTSYTEYSAEL